MDKLRMETPDLTQANIEKLAALFPACVTEARGEDGRLKKAVNFELLRQLLSDVVLEGDEAYEFTWVGKKAAIVEANRPIRKTLRPCPAESMDWDTTENLYIEGDNLEVLKLLQESYLGKVKMIYIDPPYNTGNDFIYRDDFAMSGEEYSEESGQVDEETGDRLFKNTDSNGRFHSDWCSMIYSRLLLARNLLADDGVIFISIGEEEIETLYQLCNEVFGKSRHLGTFIWKRRQMVDSRAKSGVSEDHEYMLCYAKSANQRIRGALTDMGKYSNPDNDPRGDWMSADMTGLATASQRPNLHYDICNPETNTIYGCPPLGWRDDRNRMNALISNKEIIWPSNPEGRPRRKKFVKDLQSQYTGMSTVLNTVFNTQATRELKALFNGEDYFDFPKPTELIKLMVQQGVPDEGMILDFFSGSATTAHAVMQLNAEDGGNRRYIMVQLPELCDEKSEAFKAGYKNICEIGKERIKRANLKIWNDCFSSAALDLGMILLDKELEDEMGKSAEKKMDNAESLDVGFRVFKLDSSNLKTWDAAPIDPQEGDVIGELANRMNAMIHRVKPDRSDLDMVFEVMLKLGVPLDFPVTEVSVNGKTAYSVGEDCLLLVCLTPDIQPEDVEQMAEYAPAKAVISRDSFADDTAMANAWYILRDRGVNLKLV